jgi:hypothetical protein
VFIALLLVEYIFCYEWQIMMAYQQFLLGDLTHFMFEFFCLGVFFFCCRSAIANLEKISSTDIKCYWDKNKKEAGDGFHAKPLAD